jgi:hypothetical protein
MLRFPGKLVLTVLLLLAAIPALAANVAILQNGFSIRFDRSEVRADVTRLYLKADESGYVEVPSNQIDHIEKDLTPVAAPVAPASAAPTVPAAPAAAIKLAVPTPSRSAFASTTPSTRALSMDQVVAEASSHHQLDPDLVASVIRAESGFNSRAVSPKGAQGLMQLMPQTASQLGVANAFDPRANVEGGAQYLRTLLEQYHFDLIKALAAYNAGPLRVSHYGGVPPYYETQAYVARIVRDFNRKKLAQQKAAMATKTAVKTKSATKPVASTAPTTLPQRASR